MLGSRLQSQTAWRCVDHRIDMHMRICIGRSMIDKHNKFDEEGVEFQ